MINIKKYVLLSIIVVSVLSSLIYSENNLDKLDNLENKKEESGKPIKTIVELSEQEKLLIAIPTYNEKDNILILCQNLKKVAPQADILIIDDNSPDGTGDIVDKLVLEDDHIKVIHRPSKLGLGTAQAASYDYAHEHKYTYLITMDADFTHDPKYIPDIVAARHDADIVIGSRYIEGSEIKNWGMFRLILTKIWKGCLRVGTGMSYDCTGAYRLYRVSILDPEIYKNITSPGYSFGLELLYKLNCTGARVFQVPIVAQGRVLGKSKLSTTEMWQMIKSYGYLIKLRIFGYSVKSEIKQQEEVFTDKPSAI